MDSLFTFADDLGPAKIIHIFEPSIGLKAILVIDNVACGPSIGGLRMAPDVSVSECFRLARAMTLKNAAAELPHGGGKSVLFGDPKMPRKEKEILIRAMASSLKDVKEYIFGPDMGTNEECMAWVKDEIGRAVGLPLEIGGIPLDEFGATGWGVANVAEVATEFCDFGLSGARVVVQGFGSVGRHSARFLASKGTILVAAGDTGGTIYNPKGLDVEALNSLKVEGKSVIDYSEGEVLALDKVIDIECEIWIPAARPDVIHLDNVDRLNTKLILEGANIPITYEAEKHLHHKGVLIIPDFIANAGGVICAAMEYEGTTHAIAFEAIKERVRENGYQILDMMRKQQIYPREAAIQMAESRVRRAMGLRRWNIF